MTTEMETVAGIKVIISILIGWVFYFWGYRKFRRDLLRHKLFVLKHALFITTYRMKISFDAPAYKMLNRFLDEKINHSDILNFGYCLFIWRMASLYPEDLIDVEEELRKKLEPSIYPEKYKKFVMETYDKATDAITWHLILGAPILIPLVMCGAVVALWHEVRQKKIRIESRTRNTRPLFFQSVSAKAATLFINTVNKIV